jgi:hypothetical protein
MSAMPLMVAFHSTHPPIIGTGGVGMSKNAACSAACSHQDHFPSDNLKSNPENPSE